MNKYFEDNAKELVGKTLFEFGERFDELINFTLTEGNLKGLEDYCIRSGKDFKTKLNQLCTISIRYVSTSFFEYETIVPGFISPYDIKENTKTFRLWKKLIMNNETIESYEQRKNESNSTRY